MTDEHGAMSWRSVGVALVRAVLHGLLVGWILAALLAAQYEVVWPLQSVVVGEPPRVLRRPRWLN